MNETQAKDAGYEFTGHYSHYKEELALHVKELRKKGNKACVVTIPPNKYSRSCRGAGYSVYWIESKENRNLRLADEKSANLIRLIARKDALLAEVAEVEKLITELES